MKAKFRVSGLKFQVSIIGHKVLDGADDGHQDGTANGRAADVAGQAAAATGQQSHGTEYLFSNATADQTYDGVADRSEAEFLQQRSSNVAADSATDQSDINCLTMDPITCSFHAGN